jgi:site-specific DNA-methyltransferase (adenine-specific)
MKPYYEEADITIYHGDCRELLPVIGQSDLTMTDPPYGVTDHAWDQVVEPRHWMTSKGCVCTASEPYATQLINAAPLEFLFDCVWIKNHASNALNSKRMPMRMHERILIFGVYSYFPQKRPRSCEELARLSHDRREQMRFANPGSVLEFPCVHNQSAERTEHPSQKPIDLFSYLIKTYSSGSICDPFMGSGSTLVAAKGLGRKAIGIEREERYCEIAANRLRQSVLNFEPA